MTNDVFEAGRTVLAARVVRDRESLDELLRLEVDRACGQTSGLQDSGAPLRSAPLGPGTRGYPTNPGLYPPKNGMLSLSTLIDSI